MTVLVPNFDDALVVREADAEVLGLAPLSTRLLADSNVTGGTLSIMRTTMGEGIEGARPHTPSGQCHLNKKNVAEVLLFEGKALLA
jgi:hypothetical protein